MRILPIAAALVLAACAASAPVPPQKSARQQVCVVDVETGQEDCDKAAQEAPPDSDEDCTVIEQSPTLNHGGPPAVHPFCSAAESAKTLRKPKKPKAD